MSIILQRNEYLKKVEKIYPLDTTQKKSAQFNSENFKKTSFYHYRTSLGISYMFFNSSFDQDICMESKHEAKDASFMIFNHSPHSGKIQDYNKKNDYIFKSEHYMLGKIDENFQSFNTYSSKKQYCTHYILFENGIFEDLIKEDFTQKPIFEVDGFTIKQEMQIKEQQKLILDELPTLFSLEGKLQELYLESKIIDLIYITVNDIKQTSLKESVDINSKDLECLYRARDILLEDISNPPSLKILAYQSAINEFKLKKGFKKLFGNTVFGFLQEYRLNEAKKILINNEININEVSSMVGYKNVSHFSKIFKEYFGVNPKQIKKNQKKVYIKHLNKTY